ncbi:GNAT family N-acetyltransferase [Chitinophaga sp. XS-30]|uniref:GNAT family N-acetyltransferase n=1 Tax=Chitinophaga sp. XS-30 TaxID=2604421 RepID=UPI0011DCD6D6|nr:GNAT family N-acetyltransferase [Chitinophaga sp. XS-30]QEH42777.1 GNAT family N-acetyltransferase [Chitinophaga sp. XS-30]
MNDTPVFSHAEPVLAVHDIPETIRYWQQILRFPSQWSWGDPPNIGGVSWQNAYIQFLCDPALAAASKGNNVWIRLQHIDALYHLHQEHKAEIVTPLEVHSYGMAQYTVREINGYYIHFAAPAVKRKKSENSLPSSVRITGRTPSVREYLDLLHSLGNTPLLTEEMAAKRLAAAVHGAIAEDTENGKTIGCALLLGDHASYYYVKDVMVHPDWQGRRVGTAIMQELNRWLDYEGADKALVSLITGETLEPFYLQSGFTKAFSMYRYINRREKKH